MIRDRSPIWIGLADLLLCIISVVIVAVAPVKAKTDGLKPPAILLITADWPIADESDIDLWVVGPTRKPTFYGSRQVGCSDLDHDDVGTSSRITLADGSTVTAVSHKEVTTLRCVEPGRWDVAVNNFTQRSDGPITVHVEIIGLNPNVTTLWAGNVTLSHVGQTVNTISFDLDRGGKLTLVDAPLESVLDAYEKQKSGSAP
jgi:hypothetical protein